MFPSLRFERKYYFGMVVYLRDEIVFLVVKLDSLAVSAPMPIDYPSYKTHIQVDL